MKQATQVVVGAGAMVGWTLLYFFQPFTASILLWMSILVVAFSIALVIRYRRGAF